MFRRWHQGHTLGAGIAIGLLLTYRPWIAFAAGVIAGLLLAGLYRASGHLLDAFELWRKQAKAKAAAVAPGPVPVYRKPRQTDDIPF